MRQVQPVFAALAISTMQMCLCWAAGSAPAAAATAAACPGGSIKVGAVTTQTGPADFSEVPNAAKAVFDQANASGGVNGCKIEYTIEDDKFDPQGAAQAARDLVDNRGVVALVGSASLLECQVNASYYASSNILSIQGLGVDPACFGSPNISPVNVGPYTLTTAMLYFASTHLKLKKLCADFIILGGTEAAYKRGVSDWEALSGMKVQNADYTLPIQGDITPYLLKARDAGCQAVLSNAVEPGVVQIVKTADAQKLKGIDWLFLSPGYTVQVAKALAQTQQPVYVGTEWEPYTNSEAPANRAWVAAMKTAGRPLTAFSQGGYESASVFIDVVKHIQGPVTRESVTAALRTMKPLTEPLAGTPYLFGPGKTHSSARATKVVELRHGDWSVLTPNWVVLPAPKE